MKQRITDILDTTNPVSNWWDTYLCHCDNSRADELERLLWRCLAVALLLWLFVHSVVAGMLLWSGAWLAVPIVYVVRLLHSQKKR